MKARTSGVTLLELLVAGTLLMVLLGSLGSLLVTSSRAYETNRSATSSSGQLRSAFQAMLYDLSLAGFCGVSEQCTIADALTVRASESAGSRMIDYLESTYVETRYTEITVEQSVRYEVADGKLMRSIDGGEPVAIADGIVGLEFLGYRSHSDTTPQLRYHRPIAGDLAGIDVRISYLRSGAVQSEAFSVTLQNRL